MNATETKKQTIQTRLFTYRFNTDKPAEAEAYAALSARLKSEIGPGRLFCAWNGGELPESFEAPDGVTVELETAFLFNNQWNTAAGSVTAEGARVFDWAENARGSGMFPPNIRLGHYLEQVPAMAEVRDRVHVCGYCGAHHDTSPMPAFCDKCLDSNYLKQDDLHLLRLVPASRSFGTTRAPLTEAEAAVLVPAFIQAQIHGTTERGKARIAKAYADCTERAERKIHNAEAERDGFLWLMDNGINTENWIYYDHTGRFCYGWRKPVSAEELSAFLDVASEFPFPYDVKTEDGRTLSAER